MSEYMRYLGRVIDARLEHPEWRRGQAHFNVLYEMYPQLADEIRATDLDPFYADHTDDPPLRLERYLNFVARRLA